MSDGGYDYTKLPKVSYDDYDIPDGRTGWSFQETGRISILAYIATVVICVVIVGKGQTSSDVNLFVSIALGTSFLPAIFGIIGLFRKPGRWWSLLTLIATFVINPFLLAIVFILFAGVVTF
jgi:hypothetical protein